MVDSFHCGNALHQLGIVVVNVLDQFGLRIGWPGNQNRAGVGNRCGDGLEKVVILRRVPAADGICLVVNVPGRMIRVQHQPFDIRRAEMEHPRFMVIDLNDRVVVLSHGMSPFEQWNLRKQLADELIAFSCSPSSSFSSSRKSRSSFPYTPR